MKTREKGAEREICDGRQGCMSAGKLVVKTRAAWGTRSGRGRSNASFNTLLSRTPPPTAAKTQKAAAR
jgi:hypothetical protein